MKQNLKSIIIKEYINQLISKQLSMILVEQQAPAAPPQPDPSMVAPGAPPAADPMAAGGMPPDPNAMPPADPTGAAPDPMAADPAAAGGEAPDEANDESGENSEDTDDADSFVVNKIIEMTEENENVSSTELINAAKGFIQDQKLLDPKKIHQALSIVEKLREEENPKLDDVADSIEEFLSNEFDI